MTAPGLAPNQALAGLGAVAAVGALCWSATPLGAALWAFALVVACLGYGDQLARRLGEKPSLGDAVATGLGCLIVASTLLAHVGLLTRNVQLGAVAIGLGLCAASRCARATPMPRSLIAFTAIAGVLLIGSQIVSLSPWLTDGVNHTMEVKRLWDTGQLGELFHQPGGLIIGESYVALIGGAGTAGVFDAGLAATLMVLLLATELATRRCSIALPVFLLLVVPVILNPEPTFAPVMRWSGTLFHMTVFFAFQRAVRDRRPIWWLMPSALCLIALRWEFAVLAVTYLAAGVIITRGPGPSRRVIAAVAIGWIAALAGLADHMVSGVIRAIAVAAAAALATRLVLPLLGTCSWRSPFGVLTFAVIAASLSTTLGLVPPVAHSGSAISTIWFAAAAAVFSLIDGPPSPASGTDRLFMTTGVVALVLFLTTNALLPNFDSRRRDRLRARFVGAAVELQFVARNGYNTDQDQAVQALQRRVPPGASLGVLGVSSAALDYTRNSISDLAWQGNRLFEPLSPSTIRGISYLLLEELEPPKPPPGPRNRIDLSDGIRPSLSAGIDDLLETVAIAGTARLYRIKP